MHGTWGDIDKPRIHRYDELPRDRPRIFTVAGERCESRLISKSGETAGRGVCYNAALDWGSAPRAVPRPEIVAGRTAHRLEREAAAVGAALRNTREEELPRPSWRDPRPAAYGEYLGQPLLGNMLSHAEWAACLDAVKEIDCPEPPRLWEGGVVLHEGSWSIGRPQPTKSHAEICREAEAEEEASKHNEERMGMEIRELRFKKRRAVEREQYMLAAELQREIKEIEDALQARERLRERILDARMLRNADARVPQTLPFDCKSSSRESLETPAKAQAWRLRPELKEAEEVIALARLQLELAKPRTTAEVTCQTHAISDT